MAVNGVEANLGARGMANGADPRLKPAAHEFEACLMKEFLEPLQKDALFDDGDGTSSDGSGSALMSFGSEALARAISERGGLGIATRILAHFGSGEGPVPNREAEPEEGQRLRSRDTASRR